LANPWVRFKQLCHSLWHTVQAALGSAACGIKCVKASLPGSIILLFFSSGTTTVARYRVDSYKSPH